MRLFSKIGVFVITGVLGLAIVSPVFAKDNREGKENEHREFLAEASENAGTRPGLLRNFLNKGRAAIGSGTITGINGTTLTVKDKDGKNVTVNTDSKTQFRRRFWGKLSLSEMSVGDTVNVIGQWTDDAQTTIQARLVRDISIQKRFGVFLGTVQSTSSTGFVMKTEKRGTLTVTVVLSTTKFVNRKEQTISLGDVKVDHRVRVKGLWDSKLNTLTEVSQVKDFSLPLKVSVMPVFTTTPTP